MKLSVIIISLLNRETLTECLHSLYNQSRPPDEIIVVGGKEREGSYPDIVSAVNAGIDEAKGDILVFTEDDVVPHLNWVERIEFWFNSDQVGGVGGPDEIWRDGIRIGQRRVERIGRVGRVGRLGRGGIIGRHNESAPDQDVDFLKGCNMAVRRSLCPLLDKNLIGFYRWEQDICFYLKKKGKRLLYRNDVRVRHIKEKDRVMSDRGYVFGYNTSYLVRKYLPRDGARRFFIWSLFWGDGSSPGVLRLPKRGLLDVLSSLRGKIEGWRGV